MTNFEPIERKTREQKIAEWKNRQIRNLNIMAKSLGEEPFDGHNESITQCERRLGWARLNKWIQASEAGKAEVQRLQSEKGRE